MNFRPNIILLILVVVVFYSIIEANSGIPITARPKITANFTSAVTVAYPNPFKESTTIFFNSQFDESVKVQLFTNQGKLIGDIFEDVVAKGETYRFELDGSVMNPGVYYYTIASESRVVKQKIEVVK
jgi:hypothetical protein